MAKLLNFRNRLGRHNRNVTLLSVVTTSRRLLGKSSNQPTGGSEYIPSAFSSKTPNGIRTLLFKEAKLFFPSQSITSSGNTKGIARTDRTQPFSQWNVPSIEILYLIMVQTVWIKGTSSRSLTLPSTTDDSFLLRFICNIWLTWVWLRIHIYSVLATSRGCMIISNWRGHRETSPLNLPGNQMSFIRVPWYFLPNFLSSLRVKLYVKNTFWNKIFYSND